MSYAVVRGEPYPSQIYLDGILEEVLKEKNIHDISKRDRVSLPQILYHCLKKNPDNVFMINGSTGEVITNRQILKHAVSLARALIAKGARGKTLILVMRNHQYMVALYLAAMFAKTLPFNMDPSCTVFEITHFLKLIEPCYVFCDQEQVADKEHYDDIITSLKKIEKNIETKVIVSDAEEYLKEFAKGENDSVDNFVIPDSEPESTVLLLPTSGSTGLPKAALMSNVGLVTQLPITWAYHSTIPKPTDLVMILTTLQWATFTMMVTSSLVFEVPVLISPRKLTIEHVKEMLVKFRPTWTFFNPAFVKTLLPEVTTEHFSSMKTLYLLGSPSSTDFKNTLLEKLPKTARLCDGYGSTEAQGFMVIPDPEAPLTSNGRVLNIFSYKLIDDNGEIVGSCDNGELYVKSICTIKGYYKDDTVYKETFFEGWYRTGDLFYIDEHQRLFYVERRKFSFKFRGCQVSPEEVESVIDSVSGVEESVVCGTDDGPAAAVCVHPGCDVTREQIHQTVNAALSEHKRLHGGIVFVSSLPHTHTGKLLRKEGQKVILEAKKTGSCY